MASGGEKYSGMFLVVTIFKQLLIIVIIVFIGWNPCIQGPQYWTPSSIAKHWAILSHTASYPS